MPSNPNPNRWTALALAVMLFLPLACATTKTPNPGPLAAPSSSEPRYMIADLNAIPPVQCPCGDARRAFAGMKDALASVHQVDIKIDARTHYHKKMTEIYIVIEGEGQMELDGKRFPVKPMNVIYIKPGCRHRAVGRIKIINVPIPPFDPKDEWFD